MVDQSPFLTRPEKEIIEPESRSKPKTARYASIGKTEEQEQAVTEPSKVIIEEGELPPPSEGKWGGRKKGRDKLPSFGHLNDSVNIYDQKLQDWEMAWEHRFNRRHAYFFFSNKVEITNVTVVSTPFYCAPYRNALIFYNVVRAAANSQVIKFNCEFSWDGVSFFPIWLNWWGYDQIVFAMLPHRDCMPVPILAPWIRFKYTTTGCEQEVGLNLSVFGVFNSV